MRIEQQAGAGAAALAAALRLPDEPPTGASCLAYGQVAPELWAVDAAGRAILVRVPVDSCGHFRHEFEVALDQAGWRETGRRRFSQTVPQAAIDAGCEDKWKDMAAVEARQAAAEGSPRPAGTTAGLAEAGSGKVYVYGIDDRTTPAGSFRSGRRLRDAAWAGVVGALDAAPRLGTACTTLGTRFALLLAPASDVTYVELDGCRRVLLPDGGMRKATPRLVRLVGAA